jgi:NADH-quinone oxidoreductase subunit D
MATTTLEITVDELKHLVSDRALTGETMLLNMGPQHPSTHGVLRLLLELDGERVVNCIPDIGFLHTGIEKNMEAKTFTQASVMTDLMDYLNTMGNILVYVLAIESWWARRPPGRRWCGSSDRLQRIASIWSGPPCPRPAAMSVFLYCFRRRDDAGR